MTHAVFDAEALASAFFEEVRAATESTIFSERSTLIDLTAEQRVSQLLAEAPLPDQAVLTRVIAAVFWASMLEEEGRPCSPRLAYAAPGTPAPTHRFAHPKPLVPEVLRKLSHAHAAPDVLVWEIAGGEPVLVGIELRPREQIARHRVLVSATHAGALDLAFDDVRLVTLRAGKTLRHSTCHLGDIRSVAHYWCQKLNAVPGLGTFASLVVRAILEQGHGGSLWLVGDKGGVERITIGTRLEADGMTLHERFPRAAEDALYHPWLRSIANLAAVDGAVVADLQLRPLGFGAFINVDPGGGERPRIAERLPDGGRRMIESSAEGWGGRHQSASVFCARCAPALALVVSEDGGATVFASEDGTLVWRERVVSLGCDV